jgi:hypothetical protein
MVCKTRRFYPYAVILLCRTLLQSTSPGKHTSRASMVVFHLLRPSLLLRNTLVASARRLCLLMAHPLSMSAATANWPIT